MKQKLRVQVATLISWLAIAAAGGCYVLPVAGAAEATCPTNCVTLPRPADELWIVSSRAGCNAPLAYFLYQAGAWRKSDEPTFLGLEPKTTVFYVHGLAVKADVARQEGWQIYQTLAQTADPSVPIRLVVYSWPSDISPRPLRGARSAHYFADMEGRRLAGLLEQINPQTLISLLGHSSGAKVLAATLESMADHPTSVAIPVSTQATAAPAARPVRAIFLAAAVDNNSLLPGCIYGRAISQVEQMLMVFDPCDRVLHWYRFLERGHRGPESVGYTGLASQRLAPADSARLRQINSSPYIGNQHSIVAYLGSAPLMAEVRAVALFER
jgi:hypothetical protein